MKTFIKIFNKYDLIRFLISLIMFGFVLIQISQPILVNQEEIETKLVAISMEMK